MKQYSGPHTNLADVIRKCLAKTAGVTANTRGIQFLSIRKAQYGSRTVHTVSGLTWTTIDTEYYGKEAK